MHVGRKRARFEPARASTPVTLTGEQRVVPEGPQQGSVCHDPFVPLRCQVPACKLQQVEHPERAAAGVCCIAFKIPAFGMAGATVNAGCGSTAWLASSRARQLQTRAGKACNARSGGESAYLLHLNSAQSAGLFGESTPGHCKWDACMDSYGFIGCVELVTHNTQCPSGCSQSHPHVPDIRPHPSAGGPSMAQA